MKIRMKAGHSVATADGAVAREGETVDVNLDRATSMIDGGFAEYAGEVPFKQAVKAEKAMKSSGAETAVAGGTGADATAPETAPTAGETK